MAEERIIVEKPLPEMIGRSDAVTVDSRGHAIPVSRYGQDSRSWLVGNGGATVAAGVVADPGVDVSVGVGVVVARGAVNSAGSMAKSNPVG